MFHERVNFWGGGGGGGGTASPTAETALKKILEADYGENAVCTF